MSQIGVIFAANSIDFIAVSIEFVDKQYSIIFGYRFVRMTKN